MMRTKVFANTNTMMTWTPTGKRSQLILRSIGSFLLVGLLLGIAAPWLRPYLGSEQRVLNARLGDRTPDEVLRACRGLMDSVDDLVSRHVGVSEVAGEVENPRNRPNDAVSEIPFPKISVTTH